MMTSGGRIRRQRAVVLIALTAFMMSLLLVPKAFDVADANGTGGTFACTRQTLPLWNGSGTSTTGSVTPCISGVKVIVQTAYSGGTTSSFVNGLYTVQSNLTLHDANNTSISGIDHIGFNGFQIYSQATGVSLTGGSSTGFTGTAPTPTYNFTLAADNGSPPTIGGSGVLTDLWVDRNASYVYLNNGVLCAILFQAAPCKLTVATWTGFSWLLNGSNFDLSQIYLVAYYVVTHDSSGGAPASTSIQFPSSTVTVS